MNAVRHREQSALGRHGPHDCVAWRAKLAKLVLRWHKPAFDLG
jgi:hypothetical protein